MSSNVAIWSLCVVLFARCRKCSASAPVTQRSRSVIVSTMLVTQLFLLPRRFFHREHVCSGNGGNQGVTRVVLML